MLQLPVVCSCVCVCLLGPDEPEQQCQRQMCLKRIQYFEAGNNQGSLLRLYSFFSKALVNENSYKTSTSTLDLNNAQ